MTALLTRRRRFCNEHFLANCRIERIADEWQSFRILLSRVDQDLQYRTHVGVIRAAEDADELGPDVKLPWSGGRIRVFELSQEPTSAEETGKHA